jgi:hypothetical protein
MTVLATSFTTFGIVVMAVGIIGAVVALIATIRDPDAFDRERGALWVFHGETDSSPHPMPGARLEDRHVLDPDAPPESAHEQ